MLKFFSTIALAFEPILTARTPFAPPQRRVNHVATDFATEARSFENIAPEYSCFRKRDFRFFPEDESPATIRYETLPAPTPTSHVAPASITHTPTSTASPNPNPSPSPCSPFFHHRQRKRVHPTIDIEAARVHSFEDICTTPVRYSRKGGNRFSGEVEIVAAVNKLPLKRAHGMVTKSMMKRLPIVFMACKYLYIFMVLLRCSLISIIYLSDMYGSRGPLNCFFFQNRR